jgi:hypothetical protein
VSGEVVAPEAALVAEADALRRMYLDTAIRTGAKPRVVAQWVSDWKINQGFKVPQVQTADQVAEPALPPPAPLACEFCGGDKDPYNIKHVPLHRHCMDYLRRILAEAQKG